MTEQELVQARTEIEARHAAEIAEIEEAEEAQQRALAESKLAKRKAAEAEAFQERRVAQEKAFTDATEQLRQQMGEQVAQVEQWREDVVELIQYIEEKRGELDARRTELTQTAQGIVNAFATTYGKMDWDYDLLYDNDPDKCSDDLARRLAHFYDLASLPRAELGEAQQNVLRFPRDGGVVGRRNLLKNCHSTAMFQLAKRHNVGRKPDRQWERNPGRDADDYVSRGWF